jgi:uncharacterized protein with GYD domain
LTLRQEATEKLVKSMGAKLVAYYFACGDYDGFAIVEGVDNIDATAAALIVGPAAQLRRKQLCC